MPLAMRDQEGGMAPHVGPDVNPLIGPGRPQELLDRRGSCGLLPGGGVGLCMAEWIINGDPALRLGSCMWRASAVSPRGLGPIKSREKLFAPLRLTYPNETRPEGAEKPRAL